MRVVGDDGKLKLRIARRLGAFDACLGERAPDPEPPIRLVDADAELGAVARFFPRTDAADSRKPDRFSFDLGKQLVSKGGEGGAEDSGNDFAATAQSDDAAAGGSPDKGRGRGSGRTDPGPDDGTSGSGSQV